MILEINLNITNEITNIRNDLAYFIYIDREDKSVKTTQFWKISNSCSLENLQKYFTENWPEEFI